MLDACRRGVAVAAQNRRRRLAIFSVLGAATEDDIKDSDRRQSLISRRPCSVQPPSTHPPAAVRLDRRQLNAEPR